VSPRQAGGDTATWRRFRGGDAIEREVTGTLRHHTSAGDRVLLYTDGLVEARASDGRPFALDGQVQAVGAAPSLGAALDGLVGRLLDHAGGRLDDDLALVLAQPRR
jgi:serine phosphatase RsbU (regulator of sigma subunit)